MKHSCNIAERFEHTKCRKTTRATVIQDMRYGLQAVATAIDRNMTIMLQLLKDDAQSIINVQAQTEVQEEICLTKLEVMAIINLLAKTLMARTYIVFCSL